MTTPIALITGASSGIGRATVEALAKKGYNVYAGVRRMESVASLRQSGITPVTLDVTSDDSVAAAVRNVVERAGRIDVLVNNAGYGQYGVLEDVPLTDAQRQFDANVFGLMRVTREVLPIMRQQEAGKIVNISSVAGKVSTPMAGWYSASKHAVEALSDALRLEVRPFGIDVIVLRPGAIKTGFDAIAVGELEQTTRTAAYRPMIQVFTRLVTGSYRRAPGPEVVAEAIVYAVRARRSPARVALPLDSQGLIAIKRILGESMLDHLLSAQLRPAPAHVRRQGSQRTRDV